MANINITKIPAPRTPVLDGDTNLLTPAWYRYFYNLFTITGGGTNPTNLDELQFGPPNYPEGLPVDPIDLVQQDFSTALLSTVAELTKQVQANELNAQAAMQVLVAQIANLANDVQSLAVVPPTTPQLKRRAYGSFYDVNDQTAALPNTAYAMSFSNTDLSNGVTIGSPSSRIYTDRYGIYNIQFSAQLDKTSASAKNVWIWLDKNGTSIPQSATQITLQGSSAAAVAAWNFLLELNAGDYFRLMWSTEDTDCYIKHAVAAPPVPAIPSIILTVTDNINAYQD